MDATPYLLLKGSQANRLAQRVLGALQAWADDWAALPDHAATCSDACDAPPAARAGPWHYRSLANGAGVYVALAPDIHHWMEQQVFGLEPGAAHSALAGNVADEALDALLGGLINALTGQACAAPSPVTPVTDMPALPLWRRGAGSVLCTLQLGTRTLRLLIPSAAQEAALPARLAKPASAVTPLAQALTGQTVALTVELCRAELTLSYLATLALGDVLALPMRLDAPLQLRGPDNNLICAAHLGSADGQRAVELSATTGGAAAAHQTRNRS